MRPKNEMITFNNAFETCSLFDMEWQGPRFTWKRGKSARTLVQELLDRAVATQSWANLFPLFKVTVMSSTQSNNCPFVLDTEGNNPVLRRPASKRIKFTEAALLKEEEVPKMVDECWNN